MVDPARPTRIPSEVASEVNQSGRGFTSLSFFGKSSLSRMLPCVCGKGAGLERDESKEEARTPGCKRDGAACGWLVEGDE